MRAACRGADFSFENELNGVSTAYAVLVVVFRWHHTLSARFMGSITRSTGFCRYFLSTYNGLGVIFACQSRTRRYSSNWRSAETRRSTTSPGPSVSSAAAHGTWIPTCASCSTGSATQRTAATLATGQRFAKLSCARKRTRTWLLALRRTSTAVSQSLIVITS